MIRQVIIIIMALSEVILMNFRFKNFRNCCDTFADIPCIKL